MPYALRARLLESRRGAFEAFRDFGLISFAVAALSTATMA
jgi:hypothetical protein